MPTPEHADSAASGRSQQRRRVPRPAELAPTTLAELHAVARGAGITHTGVAPAGVLLRARGELHRRRDAGLADTMQFTYRNPDRSTDPGRAVAGAAAVFVGALPYAAAEPERPMASSGRIARYAWRDHYAVLRSGLWAVAHHLRGLGWKAVAYADDNSIVDREVAHLAGLGWFGKNANLLIPGAGSSFVLGSVVTDAPLPVTAQPVADGCGACRRCIDRCPTGAIVAPGVIDARRCLSWILQKPGIIPVRWRAPIGDRLYGCDDCQDACPPTVRTIAGSSTGAELDESLHAWIDLGELLGGDDATALAAWGEWYLAARDPRWIRRNALVVAGNVASPDDHATHRHVMRYTSDPDPELRVHAIWAARRLALPAGVPASDPDPRIRAELAEPVAAR